MQHLPNASLPPPPKLVPTRWENCIEAISFYSEHSEAVTSIVAKFPSESAVSVCTSQSAFSDPKLACSITYIQGNFGWLPHSKKRLETYGHNEKFE
jgi:hypothetical protein